MSALPATAVIRLAQGSFDPVRLADVEAADRRTAEYLVPAVGALPGLISWHAGIASEGHIVNVSVWDSAEHAAQMDGLREMAVDARREMKEAGVSFAPVITYKADWSA